MSDAQVGKAGPLVPAAEEISEQLARILECQQAGLGERSRKFLNYVVTETLAGRSSRIKAYTIATDVLGRTDFDPQNDPVVRIEAARLRRDLERYYLRAGPGEPVLITIPKGGYVPMFERSTAHRLDNVDVEKPSQHDGATNLHHPSFLKTVRSKTVAGTFLVVSLSLFVATVGTSALHDWALKPNAVTKDDISPTIVVEQFDGTDNDLSAMSQGLKDLVIEGLVKFKELQVLDGSVVAGNEDGGEEETRYALEGSIRQDGNRIRSAARLVRRSDGAVIWAKNYDAYADSKSLFDIEAALADDIATAVGQPFGVLFENDLKPSGPGGWEVYDCSLSYYSYRRAMTVEGLSLSQRCLKSVTEKLSNSTSLALLSLTYLDQVRFAYKFGSKPDPSKLEVASALAKQAVDIDSKNPRALQALMLTSFFRNDVKAALAAGETALQLNPNDTEVAGEYGLRLSFSGNWQTGCDLVSKAVSKSAGPPGYYEVGMAMCAFIRNDYDAAEVWSRMSDLDYNPMHRIVLASILGASGKTDQAKREVDWLNANAPVLMSNLDQEIAKRLSRPEDRERLFAGLRSAGIAISINRAASIH